MGLSIGASGIQKNLLNNNSRANDRINQATERLSTGKRINSGRDDPAGLIGAEQLRGDLIEISARARSANAERSQLHVQQSGRQNATGVLQELRGAILGVSGSLSSPEQRAATQQQIDAALDAIERLSATTGFELPAELQALRVGGDANITDGDTAAAVEVLDEQLATIVQASAAAGAYEKYTLDVNQRIAEDQAVVTAEALSQLEDANFAEEASNLIKGKILEEASIRRSVPRRSSRQYSMPSAWAMAPWRSLRFSRQAVSPVLKSWQTQPRPSEYP